MFQYGLLDCARNEAIYPLVEQCSHKRCLLAGEIDDELVPVAPYIVELKQSEALFAIWQENWADHWGVIAFSTHDLLAVRRHFRKFLLARLPDGSPAMFRFFDPRVLNTYFRASSHEEVRPWFEKIEQIWTYNEEEPDQIARFFMPVEDLAPLDLSLKTIPPL